MIQFPFIALLFIPCVDLSLEVLAQDVSVIDTLQHGDVTLQQGSVSSILYTKGVMLVYYNDTYNHLINGSWVSVCLEGIDDGGAAAFCRQLGYSDAVLYGSYNVMNYPDPNTEYVLPLLQCPVEKNFMYNMTGKEHVFRCSILPPTTSKGGCTPTAIECTSNKRLVQAPFAYNGQVSLNYSIVQEPSISSFGMLELYFKGSWRPICIDLSDTEFETLLSACQQMGYTWFTFVVPLVDNYESWYINDLQCLQSLPCFTDCFNPSNVSSQMCQPVALQCSFDLVYANSYPAGSRSLCEISSGGNLYEDLWIVMTVLAFCLFQAFLLTLLISLFYCRKKSSRALLNDEKGPLLRDRKLMNSSTESVLNDHRNNNPFNL